MFLLKVPPLNVLLHLAQAGASNGFSSTPQKDTCTNLYPSLHQAKSGLQTAPPVPQNL